MFLFVSLCLPTYSLASPHLGFYLFALTENVYLRGLYGEVNYQLRELANKLAQWCVTRVYAFPGQCGVCYHDLYECS